MLLAILFIQLIVVVLLLDLWRGLRLIGSKVEEMDDKVMQLEFCDRCGKLFNADLADSRFDTLDICCPDCAPKEKK